MGILSNILDISGFFLIVVINLSLIALLCYYAKKKFESIEEIQKEQSKILFNLVHSASNTATIGQAPSSQIDPMFLSPSVVNIPQVSEENKIINMTSTTPQVINLESDSDSESESETEPESDSDDESGTNESVDEEEELELEQQEEEDETVVDENDSDDIEELTVNEENSLILEEIENEANKEVLDIDVNLLKGNLEENSKEVLLSLEQDSNEEEQNFDKMTITQLKNYISSKGKTISSKTTKKSDILEYIKLNNI